MRCRRSVYRRFCTLPYAALAIVFCVLIYYSYRLGKWHMMGYKHSHDPVLMDEEDFGPYSDLKEAILQQNSDSAFRLNITASYGKTGLKFWNSIKPVFNCSTKKLVGVNEGASESRWTCGLEKLRGDRGRRGHNCIIYSFGLSQRLSFEKEVLEFTSCQLFLFDEKRYDLGTVMNDRHPRVRFHRVGIFGRDNEYRNRFSLKTLLKWNNHSFVEILKMNVHGLEFHAINGILQNFKSLPFAQLILDVHVTANRTMGNKYKKGFKKTLTLLKRLDERGVKIFHVEPEGSFHHCCASISFINFNRTGVFLDKKPMESD